MVETDDRIKEENNPFTEGAPVDSVGAGGRDVPPGQEEDYKDRLKQARGAEPPLTKGGTGGVAGDSGVVGGQSQKEEGTSPEAGIDNQSENVKDQKQESRIAGVLRRMAAKRGLSGGMSGEADTAIAAKGATDAVQRAASQRLLSIAFKFLASVYGSVPALLYLNFHYIMSLRGSKRFQPMLFWQKIVLLFVDILAFIILLLIIIVIVYIYKLIENPAEALKLFS